MRSTSTLLLIAALSLAGAAFAQTTGMGGMDMKDKQSMDCMGMKGMDASKCKDMMRCMNGKPTAKTAMPMPHETDAVVKGVDAALGKVALAHEPVKSLGWGNAAAEVSAPSTRATWEP